MANGQPGKKLTDEQRQQVEDLLRAGVPVLIVVDRTGVSASQVRNVQREMKSQSAIEIANELWPDN